MHRLILLFLIPLFTLHLHAQSVVIHAGTLVDVINGETRNEVTIIIDGQKIVSISDGYAKPGRDAQLIDLKNYTVMPGLFDMHVHIESETSPYIERFTLDPADVAFNSVVYARKTLLAGFTSVRDLGGTGVNTSLRDAIREGKVIGPTIYSAGKAIATTGGHADPTNGYKKSIMGDPGPDEGVINGPDEARKAVRQRYKNGADVIKITATGGVLSLAADGSGPQFRMDELEAIVETAHDYGMVTAAHAHGADGMKRAVIAGIKTIEHGTYMTEEIMDLMIEKGTYMVPTITAGKAVAEYASEGKYPPIVEPKALAVGPQIQSTFAKAYARGVNICFGTDAGVFPHGDNGREFQFMTEAGMPMMEAIQSATIVPATILGVDIDFGSVVPGKTADIIAVEGDPLKDPLLMQHVGFVMKGGVVYKNE